MLDATSTAPSGSAAELRGVHIPAAARSAGVCGGVCTFGSALSLPVAADLVTRATFQGFDHRKRRCHRGHDCFEGPLSVKASGRCLADRPPHDVEQRARLIAAVAPTVLRATHDDRVSLTKQGLARFEYRIHLTG